MALLEIIARPAGPVTHALVIGVGSYPHLIGGNNPQRNDHWGLHQLPSAPLCALAFADWLVKSFHHPAKPLASIEHLISAPHQIKDAYGVAQAGEEPTMAALEEACARWRDRAGSHPDSIAVLYFCGHGISRGVETGLLAADFGVPNLRLTKNAVNLRKTLLGMFSCKANNQCYFIDACRTPDEKLQSTITGLGEPLVDCEDGDVRSIAQPVCYSTGLTQEALGIPGEVSPFTSGLIKALDGMAAEDSAGLFAAGKCEVDTGGLIKAIRKAMEMDVRRRPWLGRQHCEPDGPGNFVFHYPRAQIRVPLLVGCRPDNLTGSAALALSRDRQVIDQKQLPALEIWETWQPPGSYQLSATLDDGRVRSQTVMLYPACREPFLEF